MVESYSFRNSIPDLSCSLDERFYVFLSFVPIELLPGFSTSPRLFLTVIQMLLTSLQFFQNT
jgi:hypothetical protein